MLKRIDHIGVVVADLPSAKEFLEKLGMSLELEQDLPHRSAKVAFYRCGDGLIELIEPTTSEARLRRLGDGNRARLEHVAVEVEDISKAMEAIQGLGVKLTTDQPVVTIGRSLNVWTRPETSEGIQYQFVEKDPS